MNGDTCCEYKYDVALSFAGEQRDYVEQVAGLLREKQINVFYDKYEKVDLWGKDLYQHLSVIYKEKARYCVIFASKNYKERVWATHELQAAQARAITENREYILPARFDDTEIPGILPTIGYIPLKDYSPPEFAEMLIAKIGLPLPENYLPLPPQKLFDMIEIIEDEYDLYESYTRTILDDLSRLTIDEKLLLYHIITHSCPANLPDNLHIHFTLLKRITGFDDDKMKKLIETLNPLGFSLYFTEDDGHTYSGHPTDTEEKLLNFEYICRRENLPNVNITWLLIMMVEPLQRAYCEDHAIATFLRLDFSILE